MRLAVRRSRPLVAPRGQQALDQQNKERDEIGGQNTQEAKNARAGGLEG